MLVQKFVNPSTHFSSLRLNETKTVLQRLSERLSISEISTGDLSSVTNALDQMLTESSSSGKPFNGLRCKYKFIYLQ